MWNTLESVHDSTVTCSNFNENAESDDLQPGQLVGEYRIEHKLGQGRLGAVFKAVHPLIGKRVAIKVLSQRSSIDPQMVFRHPSIVDIFSSGTLDDGRHYYVMEYLDGEPLDRRLAREGRMTLGDAIPILRGIARALDAAHAKGIAHRDLKAENIFVAAHPDGVFPKLLDLGIAQLLEPGAPIGTPHYMSPQQCRGRQVDHRTDLYAFGVLAYLMLTGAFPFDGDDYVAILIRQVHDEPAPPSSLRPELPAGVDAVIAALMHKDPASRPATLMAAVRMLEQTASGRADATPSPSSARAALPSASPGKSGASALRRPLSMPRSAGLPAIAAAMTRTSLSGHCDRPGLHMLFVLLAAALILAALVI